MAYYQANYWAAFAFRKDDYDDWYNISGYMVYYRYNGSIELHEAGAGVLATSNTGLNLSTWRHVKIVVSGSAIAVYVDGNLEISHSDGTYTDGYFGLNVFGVAARYDDLEIRDERGVHYIWDVNGDVLAEYNEVGDLLAEYVYANGQRIAKLTPAGGADTYLNDHLGSARAMTGSGWSANYYPFGEVASQTGSGVDTRFDFTGQVGAQRRSGSCRKRDAGTGLMYFGARYYDPEIGRLLSVDRFADKYPSMTPYQYAANNPVLFVDVTGDTIEVADVETREAFINSLPYEARKFVRFDNKGILDVEFLAQNTKGIDDINLKAALIIGAHETTAFVHLTDRIQFKDQEGNVTEIELTGTSFQGFTVAPDGSEMQSVIPGKIDVMINKNLSQIGRVKNIGHELFGHARFYVEGRPWEHELRPGFGGYDFNRLLQEAIQAHQHQAVLNLFRLMRKAN